MSEPNETTKSAAVLAVSENEPKEYRQSIRFIQAAFLIHIVFTAIVAFSAVPANRFMAILGTFNIIDIVMYYFLLKLKSENARQFFLFRIGVGCVVSMITNALLIGILTAVLFYLPLVLLVTGESKRWRMITACILSGILAVDAIVITALR